MASRRAGFTLIELMVAVAILGLCTTILFLKVDTLLPGARLQSACKRVVTDLELLRSQAVFTAQPVFLEYDVKENRYRAYFPLTFDEEGNVEGAGETEIIAPVALGETVQLVDVLVGYVDGSAPVDAGVQTICIRPDGSLTGHIVQLRNIETNEEMSVRIASLTGFAEITAGLARYEEVRDESF